MILSDYLCKLGMIVEDVLMIKSKAWQKLFYPEVQMLNFSYGEPIDMNGQLAIYRSSSVQDNVLTVAVTFPRNIRTNDIGYDTLRFDQQRYREHQLQNWTIASRSDVERYMVPLMEGTVLESEIDAIRRLAR